MYIICTCVHYVIRSPSGRQPVRNVYSYMALLGPDILIIFETYKLHLGPYIRNTRAHRTYTRINFTRSSSPPLVRVSARRIREHGFIEFNVQLSVRSHAPESQSCWKKKKNKNTNNDRTAGSDGITFTQDQDSRGAPQRRKLFRFSRVPMQAYYYSYRSCRRTRCIHSRRKRL